MASYQPRQAYGPWLRYQDVDYSRNAWKGSILVVSLSSQTPQFWCSHAGNQIHCQPQCLDTFQNFKFWKWPLDLFLQQSSSIVEYGVTTEWLAGQPHQKSFRFTLPGAHETWHWGFHSCNGFSSDVAESWKPAATTLWQDVLRVHQQSPLHCMVGGGDQLYQDAVFKEPAMVLWLKQERKMRETTHPTPDMDAQIHHFMFHHYCNWFSMDHVSEVFACVPQVMTWDDHDLMDGWGSYPDALQNCPVFQFAYRVARRFYLLFQQHTTMDLAHEQAGLFGNGETFSMLRMLSRNVALIAPDVRGERTRKQVVSPANWELIFQKINNLPGTVKHLVMLTTIPVVYPKIPLSEKALGILSGMGSVHAVDNLMAKTGLWKAVQGKVVSHFEEPELLDDLLDHWTSDFHIKERDMLISRLQGLSQLRNMRVMFISGDVHVGGLGRLYSDPKIDLRKDHRFMPQIVSSAIMNAPPPSGVISVLHASSNAHCSSDKHTKEKMVRIFKDDYPKTDKLVARRNWTDIREVPVGGPIPYIKHNPKVNEVALQGGDLLAVLRVEKDHKMLQHSPIQEYPIISPVLDTGRPSISPQGSIASQQYSPYGTQNSQSYGSTMPLGQQMPQNSYASQPQMPSQNSYAPQSQGQQYGYAPSQSYSMPSAQSYNMPSGPVSQGYYSGQMPQTGISQQYSQGNVQVTGGMYGQGQPTTQQPGMQAPYPQSYPQAYTQNPGNLSAAFGNMTVSGQGQAQGSQGMQAYPSQPNYYPSGQNQPYHPQQ